MQTNQCFTLMAVKYNYRNQNSCKLMIYKNCVHQRAFHETNNINEFVVSSFVKHRPDC